LKGAPTAKKVEAALYASASPKDLPEAEGARTETPSIAVREGAPLGRIEIRRIGLEAMILEGTEEGTLHLAVGHIPGTPLPGQPGNVALAGHRDTLFRALRNIRKDDEIMLTTLGDPIAIRWTPLKWWSQKRRMCWTMATATFSPW
jgi:sortase (surface protein transpeptidase)